MNNVTSYYTVVNFSTIGNHKFDKKNQIMGVTSFCFEWTRCINKNMNYSIRTDIFPFRTTWTILDLRLKTKKWVSLK